MSDNVVKFPKKEGYEEDELKAAAKQLEQIQLARKSALEGLRKRVQNLMENEKLTAEHMAPASVEALRDVASALNFALTGIDAYDKMTDMITHDIIGLVQNVDALSGHLFQTSAVTQTILEVLKTKGLLTSEEMKQTWDKMVKAKEGPTQE